MSGKDEYIFTKAALTSTKCGKEILKQILLRKNGYKQFTIYKKKYEEEFDDFTKRFLISLHHRIISDSNPSVTMKKFIEEVGSSELILDDKKLDNVKTRLSRPENLADRIVRILNSNFVKMAFPVLNALFDGASAYNNEEISTDLKNSIIDGHIIAVDLSEPMDRIMDKDEDVQYLDDYKLMNPYILEVAREKISKSGDSVLKAFEEGFRSPLSDIYDLGMAKAAECVGCGNEIEDSIKQRSIKIPSWPLYYSLISKDVEKAFEITLKKSEIYLEEAKLAMDMLPFEFQFKPFLEFLFLTVNHYNQYWYNELMRGEIFTLLQKDFDITMRK
jgi:hypothetical protein